MEEVLWGLAVIGALVILFLILTMKKKEPLIIPNREEELDIVGECEYPEIFEKDPP